MLRVLFIHGRGNTVCMALDKWSFSASQVQAQESPESRSVELDLLSTAEELLDKGPVLSGEYDLVEEEHGRMSCPDATIGILGRYLR